MRRNVPRTDKLEKPVGRSKPETMRNALAPNKWRLTGAPGLTESALLAPGVVGAAERIMTDQVARVENSSNSRSLESLPENSVSAG